MLYEQAIEKLQQSCLPLTEKINLGDKFKFAELVPIQGLFSQKQENLANEYAIVYHNAKIRNFFDGYYKNPMDIYYLVEFPTGERSIKFRHEIMERVDYVES